MMIRVFNPETTMFCLFLLFTNRLDNDRIEQMSRLKTVTESHLVTGRTNDANILDEKIVPLKCPRCGFVNTKASLVCKECNTLLKDNGLFSQKKALQFYWGCLLQSRRCHLFFG